jgi:hypothetical protein
MKLTIKHRYPAISIAALALLLAGSPMALTQRNTNPAANKDVNLRELLKAPGQVISEAKSAEPTGELRLTGYRVEEIQLPRSLNVEVQGRQATVNKAWRVTVNGGPFPVRALPAVIWIDDQIAGNGIENETLSQVTAITFDESLIHDGGVVSISYGESKENRVRIPQGLQLRREGGNQ